MEWKRFDTGSIVVDERRFPLVLTRFVDVPTSKAIDIYLERADSALELGEPYALVVEATTLRNMSAAHRKRFGHWLSTRRQKIGALCVGQAYVMESVVQRMILRSIFMISPLPAPYVVVLTREQALEWCAEKLRNAGAEIPDAPADW